MLDYSTFSKRRRSCHPFSLDRVANVFSLLQKDASSVDSNVLLDRHKNLVERYRKSITRVQDEGIENELKNLKDYRNDVLMLYNLKL